MSPDDDDDDDESASSTLASMFSIFSSLDDVDANCTSAILALFFLVVFSVVIVSSVKVEEVKRLFADIVPLCVFSFDDDDEDADVLAFVFFATKRRFGSLLLVPEASGVR